MSVYKVISSNCLPADSIAEVCASPSPSVKSRRNVLCSIYSLLVLFMLSLLTCVLLILPCVPIKLFLDSYTLCSVYISWQKARPTLNMDPDWSNLFQEQSYRAAIVPTSASSTLISPPVYVASTMVMPMLYSGLVEDCIDFLLQCSLALERQPHQFPTERANISFIISHLSGCTFAMGWNDVLPKWSCYCKKLFLIFEEVFGHPVGYSSVCEQLYHLQQGSSSITE